MRRPHWSWPLLIALLGFACGPACFLPYGSREPLPARAAPAHGPEREDGGQRLRAPFGTEAAARARQALTRLGWTPTTSTRSDEVLGVLHDNLAVVRWSSAGWWVRVEQRSDFLTHEQVPTWDHPWEALRLLHLLAPDAGPAEGWNAWPSVPPIDGSAEERWCRAVRTDTVQTIEPAAADAIVLRWFTTPPTCDDLVARIQARAATTSQPYRTSIASFLAITTNGWMRQAMERKQDPYTWLPPTVRLDAQTAPACHHVLVDDLSDTLVQRWNQERRQASDARLSGSGRRLTLPRDGSTLLRRWQVPGWQELGTDITDEPPSVPYRHHQDIIEETWWTGHGRAWVEHLLAANER